jgi:hypothetical protein
MKTSLKVLLLTALFIFVNQQVQGQRLLKSSRTKYRSGWKKKLKKGLKNV